MLHYMLYTNAYVCSIIVLFFNNATMYKLYCTISIWDIVVLSSSLLHSLLVTLKTSSVISIMWNRDSTCSITQTFTNNSKKGKEESLFLCSSFLSLLAFYFQSSRRYDHAYVCTRVLTRIEENIIKCSQSNVSFEVMKKSHFFFCFKEGRLTRVAIFLWIFISSIVYAALWFIESF